MRKQNKVCQKVYFVAQSKNSEKSVPKSPILSFGTFRKSSPLFGTERSIMDNRIYRPMLWSPFGLRLLTADKFRRSLI